MTDNSFSLAGKNFKLSKMDAFKQFHVVRKVGPVLAEIIPSLSNSAKKDVEKMSENERLEMVGKFLAPVCEGLSKLSDAESEAVLHGLLSCVEMEQPGMGWAKVSVNNLLMVQLELPILLQLAGRAFMFNLSGFFSALPAK